MNDNSISIYIDSLYKTEVIGCGYIFYKFNKNNKMELFLNKNLNAKYEDIGGYISSEDKTYENIAMRNINILTHGAIISDIILSIKSKQYYVYNSVDKYLIIIVKANDFIKNLYQININNTEIDWISLHRFSSKSIIKNSLHKRIASKDLIFKLKEIEYLHRLRIFTKNLPTSPTTSDDFSTDSNASN
jgi:hypothetical protein